MASVCEYDGAVLPLSTDGLPDACPECEADLQDHMATCQPCAAMPNLPDRIDASTLLGLFATGGAL